MFDRTDRPHVAWDIETTGFGCSEAITVSGFWFPDGHATLVVNAGPHEATTDDLAQPLRERSGAAVRVHVAADEAALLATVGRVLFDRFDRASDRLVAYNGDSWQGGFDLPFVRSRCVQHGTPWPFDGMPFADLYEPVKKRFNTTHVTCGAAEDANSLTGAHRTLLDRGDDPKQLFDECLENGHPWYGDRQYDPFVDSGSAAAHYRQGALLAVCAHNLADIHRTWELGELVRTFVPAADVSDKKL